MPDRVSDATEDQSASSRAARWCNEGYAQLEAGNLDAAQTLLLRACALAPSDALIHFRLALLYSDLRRLPDALAELDRTLLLEPGHARAHNNRGSVLQQLGRDGEAEAAYRRAIALDASLEQPFLNLGDLLAQRGDTERARAIYQDAIARGHDAGLFGQQVAAISGRTTDRSPDSWVRKHFDYFAPTFDATLDTIGYVVPVELAAVVDRNVPPGRLDVLDLGCGTGKCGATFAPRKRRLVGVDLSEKMLATARSRRIYDELHASEIHGWLSSAASASFDLVVAADVLIYIGDLTDLFHGVATVLRRSGWFAFSIELCEGSDFELLGTGRYAQSEDYVRRSAAPSFDVISSEAVVLRTERGRPVAGRVFLLQRR